MLELWLSSLTYVSWIILSMSLLACGQLSHPSCVSSQFSEKDDSWPEEGTSMKTKAVSRLGVGLVLLEHAHCLITREKDDCVTFKRFITLKVNVSEKWIVWSENSTERAYVNLTTQSDMDYHTNWYLLQDNDGTCWNIHVSGDYPHRISVYNLPVLTNFSYVTAAAEIKEHDHHSSTIFENICTVITNSTFVFTPISFGNSVKLTITVKADGPYRIELMSGECDITCLGTTNNCSVNLNNNTIYNLTSGARKEISYYDLKPANYCARIGSIDNYCLIYTKTVGLVVSDKTWYKVASSHPGLWDTTNLVLVFSAAALVCILMVIISLVILLVINNPLFGVVPTSRASIPKTADDESVSSLVPKTQLDQLFLENQKSTQIYLVYSNDSQQFLDLMTSFSQLLRNFFQKVWDLQSDEESASKDVGKWVGGLLSDSNVRILLVETNVAVQIQQLSKREKQHPCNEFKHFYNDVFTYTLAVLEHNSPLNFDYTRVFIVSFNSTATDKLSNILSNTRYQMPDHFEQLIYNMGRFPVVFEEFSRFEIRCDKKEEFIRALHVYNSTI